LHQIIKNGEVGKDNQLRMYCVRFTMYCAKIVAIR